MVKRILLPLMGTSYTPAAIERSLELARRHAAVVTGIRALGGLTFREQPVPIGGAAVVARLREKREAVVRSRVEQAAQELRRRGDENGVPVTLIDDDADIVAATADHWRHHDLVVVGLRGLAEHSSIEEAEDLAVRLIAAGVRPILTVAQQLRTIDRVLVAHSGSMESAKTLKRFVQLRLWPEIDLRIVHFAPAGGAPPDWLTQTRAYCAAWDVPAEAELIPGHVRSDLLPFARRTGADLIVLGDSARHILTRRFLGDTVRQVIHDSELPLFLSH